LSILKIPLYKKLLSYVAPVTLRKVSTPDNPVLELAMVSGRFQLATREAYYSDGDKYEPAIITCTHFASILPSLKNVLVLGTGLGSIMEVMTGMGGHPEFTLVEKDKVVLQWAMELAAEGVRMHPVCEDAGDFILRDTSKYDFIFVDIFNGRHVPPFVTSKLFLSQVRARLAENGRLALNYIVNDTADWEEMNLNFADVFPGHKLLERRENKIFVA